MVNRRLGSVAACVVMGLAAWASPPAGATPNMLHVEFGPDLTAPLITGPVGFAPDDEAFFENGASLGSPRRSRGRFGERGVFQSPTRPSGGPISLSPALRFYPAVKDRIDPTLAVGDKYIVVSEAHNVSFYDKKGVPLQPGGGVYNGMSYNALFAGFVAPTNKDGSVNQNNINRNLNLGFGSPIGCDATKSPTPPSRPFAPTDACVNEFYDFRAFYDRTHKRFVLVGQARNTLGIWTEKQLDNKYDDTQTWRQYLSAKGYSDTEIENLVKFSSAARRYLVFAVSRSEDPRAGFHEYILTQSNYADWPKAAFGERLLVLSHNAPPQAGRPALYGIGLDAIESGQPDPPYATLGASAFGGGSPTPVSGSDYGGGSVEPVWLLDDSGSPTKVYALPDFAQPASAFQFLSSKTVTPPLGPITGMLRTPPVYRNGRLCAASPVVVETRPAGYAGADDPPRLSIRVTCFKAGFPKSSLVVSTAPSEGGRDRIFGLNALQDAPTDRVSYELPALAVNERNDIFVGYDRRSVHPATKLPPEARYTLWDANASTPRRSRLLKPGDAYLALRKRDFPDTIDLDAAVVDPSDDTSFWTIGAYAKSGNLSWAVGKVKP